MNSIALPLVLLGLATGIAIAHAAPRPRVIAFVTFAVACSLVASLRLPGLSFDNAAFACWIVVVACSATVLWPHMPGRFVRLLAGAGGCCAGALAAAAGGRPEGYVLAPAIATLLLASWCLHHGARAAVHVVASWLIAVVLLVASVHALPVTPGDRPDHLE
jgi:hypothetical protein